MMPGTESANSFQTPGSKSMVGSRGSSLMRYSCCLTSLAMIARSVSMRRIEATALQRKLAQEADEKMFAELKAKGVQIDKVDQAPFMKATAPVVAKWEASPIGPFVRKVITAARAQ